MKLKIEIDLDNSAFEDDKWAEISRVLNSYIKKVEESGTTFHTLRDINGNSVGSAQIIK